MTDTDTFLAHFGVKGMKWGIRKDRDSTPKNKSSEPLAIPKDDSKSGYRVKLEAKNMRAGLSFKEAEAKAAKAIKIQKIIAITAGVTLAAAAAYVGGRKLGKEFVGANVKMGTPLQHISRENTINLTNDHLYTTYKRADKFNYQGTFSTEIGALTGTKTHALKLAAKKTIKAPSNHQGKQILSEITGKKVSTEEYRDFINGFNRVKSTDTSAFGTRVANFKKAAASKGFNAVIDTTDQNAYAKAYKPLIVFSSKEHLVQEGARALSKDEVLAKALTVYTGRLATSPLTFASTATGAAAIGGSSVMSNRQINDYYKMHPNSNLSRAEVAMAIGLA